MAIGEAAAAQVLLEDRRGDGAPLVGVGAAPELVEEDEAPRRRGGERRGRARHRAGEGGEVAEEVLRVPRDDEEPVEDGERRPGVGGDGEARLREEREEADGLHRDRLAAGVRAGEEDEPLPLVELEVERHGVGAALLGPLAEDLLAQRREAPVEKRVAGLLQDERAVRLGKDARRAARQLGARLVAVELGEDLHGGDQLGSSSPRSAR